MRDPDGKLIVHVHAFLILLCRPDSDPIEEFLSFLQEVPDGNGAQKLFPSVATGMLYRG
jgi:hypothetical protein